MMKKQYCEIFNLCFPQFKMCQESFSNLFDAEKAVCFEHTEDGEVVAFAVAEDHAIRLICVAPSMQRSGIGKKLLNDAEQHIAAGSFQTAKIGGVSSKLFIGAVSDSWGFFEKCGYKAVGGCDEMLLELKDYSVSDYALKGHDIATYGWFGGNIEEIKRAVDSVDPDWNKFFTEESSILVGRVDNEIACFCLVDLNCHNYLSDSYGKVGMPGCVGTVPKFRNKGIALEMIARVTQYLKDEGMDISFIFYTGVAKWYEKLGYKTFLSEVFGEKNLI